MFEVNFLRFNWRWLSKQVNYLIDKPFELDRTMVHRTRSCLNWTNFYLLVYRVVRFSERGVPVRCKGAYGEFSLYNFDMYKTRLDWNSSHFFYFTLILFWSKIKFSYVFGPRSIFPSFICTESNGSSLTWTINGQSGRSFGVNRLKVVSLQNS